MGAEELKVWCVADLLLELRNSGHIGSGEGRAGGGCQHLRGGGGGGWGERGL